MNNETTTERAQREARESVKRIMDNPTPPTLGVPGWLWVMALAVLATIGLITGHG